jgi:uncharacterized membrane protein YdbT with pleckstrin-like domain
MFDLNTIQTKNSRRLYVPYYALFLIIFFIVAYMSVQGMFTLPFFTASIVLIFLGINATEIHRIWQSYEINPHSVVHTKGYLSRHSRRIDLFAINSVTVTQTLYQRVFNIGDIHIHVANASHQTTLKNIHNPRSFAQTIERNMHKLRNTFQEDDSTISQLSDHSKKDDFFDSPIEKFDRKIDAETSDNLQEI